MPVYAVDAGSADAPAARSRYVRGHILLPRPGSAPSTRSSSTLLDLAQRPAGAPASSFPTDDVAALFVDEHPRAGEAFRLPAQPAGLPRELGNKRRLHELCLSAAIPSPEAASRPRASEMLEQAEELGFPVVHEGDGPDAPAPARRRGERGDRQDREEVMALYDAWRTPTSRT